MPELSEVRFPKQGHTWTPLPKNKETNRVQAHAVQTIQAAPEEIYNVFSRVELLHVWQEGVVSVMRTGSDSLHFVMQDPGTGKQFEFDAQELEKIPGKRFVSRVTTGPTEGTTDILTLEPHPSGRGTIATLISDYSLPGGWLTSAVTSVISRRPEQITVENLRHLKELIESGQIPTVEGQPAGRRGISGKLKQFLLGENLPTPPGTRERASPEDLPVAGRLLSSKLASTVGMLAVPLLLGVVIWASLSDSDS